MAAIRGFFSNVGDAIVGAGKKLGNTVEQGIQGVGDGVAAFGKAIKDLSETVVRSTSPAKQQKQLAVDKDQDNTAGGRSNEATDEAAEIGHERDTCAHRNLDATAHAEVRDDSNLSHHHHHHHHHEEVERDDKPYDDKTDLEETYFYAYVTRPRDLSARSPAVVPVGHELRVFVVPLHDHQSKPAKNGNGKRDDSNAASSSSGVAVSVDGRLSKVLMDPQIPFGLRVELRNYVAEPNVVMSTPLVVVEYEAHSHHLELSATLLSMTSGNYTTESGSSTTNDGLGVRVKWFTQSHQTRGKEAAAQDQYHLHHFRQTHHADQSRSPTSSAVADWRTVALFEHGPRRAHWYPTEEAKLHLLLEDRLGARLAIEDRNGAVSSNTNRLQRSPNRGDRSANRRVSSAKRYHLELYASSPRRLNLGSRPASGESAGSSQHRKHRTENSSRTSDAFSPQGRPAGVAATTRPLRRDVSAEFPVVVRPPRQEKPAAPRPATGNSANAARNAILVPGAPPPLVGHSKEVSALQDACTTAASKPAGSAGGSAVLTPRAPGQEQTRVHDAPSQHAKKPPLPSPSAAGPVSARLYREQTTDPRLVAASLRRRWELLDDERQNFDVYLERAVILDSLFLESV